MPLMRNALYRFGHTEDWTPFGWVLYLAVLVLAVFLLVDATAGLLSLFHWSQPVHIQHFPVAPRRS